MPNRDNYNSKTASLRDFSGGWNVTDDDSNLSRKFQVLSDNMIVGVDNTLDPRFGNKLIADAKLGVETVFNSVFVTAQTTSASPFLRINWPSHGLTSGMHIRVDSFSATIANLVTQPTGTYGVLVGDANTIYICLRDNATGTATSGTLLFSGMYDTHMLGGNILDGTYFQGYSIIFTDIGEVIALDDNRNFTRIWDFSKSYATAGNPPGWRKLSGELPLLHVSFDTNKQTLIAVNGRLNDKPIEIDMTRATPCQYLVDPATSSNSFVYSAEFIVCFNNYTLLMGSNNTATPTSNKVTTVDISAKGTTGVFVGNPAPDSAVQIDLGRITQTVEPRITGVSNIRNLLFVSFYDSAMLGKLGVFTTGATPVHDPDFSDQIPQHGSINHRVLANIGNDLFMCDYAGVPAFTQSYQSQAIVPERVSELISPVLNAHLGRLGATTLRYKPFAVFSPRDRQYMLFIPKFDSSSAFTSKNPFTTITDLSPYKRVLVHASGHTVSEGDYVTVSGAVTYSGVPDTSLNGKRLVTGIVDENYFLMEVGTTPAVQGASGGGTVTFSPVNDEMIGYIFTINAQLKIKRWTRYRNLTYTAGWTTRDGRVLFVSNNRIMQHGTKDSPLYADNINYYDYRKYAAGTAYAVGDRVFNSIDGLVYQCQIAYTSFNAAFDTEIAVFPNNWAEYTGDAINFAAETPWSDNGDPLALKINSHLRVATRGTAAFTISAFVDDIYQNPVTLARSPKVQFTLSGRETGGYGAGDQNYGGGIRTKEKQLLGFPMRYTKQKLRIEGSAKTKLAISGIHLLYQKGSAWR